MWTKFIFNLWNYSSLCSSRKSWWLQCLFSSFLPLLQTAAEAPPPLQLHFGPSGSAPPTGNRVEDLEHFYLGPLRNHLSAKFFVSTLILIQTHQHHALTLSHSLGLYSSTSKKTWHVVMAGAGPQYIKTQTTWHALIELLRAEPAIFPFQLYKVCFA